MVALEHRGLVWLQEERQVVNSRRGKDISGMKDLGRGLAQRFKDQ